MSDTFYWHDYETFGTDPARDRAVQFAGLRTDADLNIIGEPLVIYARPANDVLPHPQACLITGITPQKALAEGLPECEFISQIHAELALPGTCGVGYNSLRFDDEVTRYTLYRNFYDPYTREWQNGNSRWDIIDMVRTAYALRPDGIEWPLRSDGLPSFRLEELTAANGIGHESAHDALSDVYATIAVARLIKERQPRLYDYVLSHRDKRSVLAQLDMENLKPVLHVTGMFGAQRSNIGLIVPLAMHPENSNEVICFDLQSSVQVLEDLTPAALAERLFSRTADLPEGEARPGLKSIHINRCPVIAPATMANPEIALRVGIDGALCRANLARLREMRAKGSQQFTANLQKIYSARQFASQTDPDLMLYSGGFFSGADKRSMDLVRASGPDELGSTSFVFEDNRLPEMLLRYRARNYPESLSPEELDEWDEFRYQRLTDPLAGGSLSMEAFQLEIEQLLADPACTPQQRGVLQQLLEYGDTLLA